VVQILINPHYPDEYAARLSPSPDLSYSSRG
jgi:hypothetical protein